MRQKICLVCILSFFVVSCQPTSKSVNTSETVKTKTTTVLANTSPTSTLVVSSSNNIVTNKFEMPKNAPAPSSAKTDYQKVLDQIRAKAQQDFPDDYVMQKFVYDEQLKAYKYMKSLPASSIKSKAESDFPDDYVMQKFVYEEQTKAKQEMDQR